MPSDTMEPETKASGNNHDDEAGRTRTRVSRACTRCRSRKDRCDGQRPSCSACLNAHQTCCYEPSTKKRGLPEGYVRGLEKLYALLIGKVDGFEEMVTQLIRNNRVELGKLWNHATVGEEMHTTWKESKVLTELEALLSSVEQVSASAGQKRKRERDDDGSMPETEPDLNFHLQPIYSITHHNHDVALARRQVRPVEPTSTKPSLPRQTLQILDYYFAYTHCWFPVVNRSNLTRACYELSRNTIKDAAQEQEPLLWAIIAYTVNQLRSIGDANMFIKIADLPPVQDLRTSSIDLLPPDSELKTIIHAQTLLMLSLFEIGVGQWSSAWILTGKAVRIVLRTISDSRHSETDTATLQGCIILDTAIALHLRCPPHLRKTDIQAAARLFEDGREEWEPWSAPGGVRSTQEPSFSISCFNRLTDVFLCLSDVFRSNLATVRSDKENVHQTLAALHQLQTTFPGSTPPTDQSPPHQICLQICHATAQMRLVDLPVEVGTGPNERVKLASNVLSLLTLCQTTDPIMLAFLPPFVADSLDLVPRLTQSSVSAFSFGVTNELPSIQDCEAAVFKFLHKLALIWPVYSQVLGHASATNHSSGQDLPLSSSVTNVQFDRPNDGRPSSTDPNTVLQNEWPLLDLSSLQGRMDFQNTNSKAVSFGNTKIVDLSFGADTSILGEQQTEGVSRNPPFDRLPNSFDLDMVSARLSSQIDPALMEASPSFNGDEIDAIFHEMAHLDTNEWSSERAMGLKDFGFADDSTFQAFCNDPDRVIESLTDGQQTLSSNIQTWMFTNDTMHPS